MIVYKFKQQSDLKDSKDKQEEEKELSSDDVLNEEEEAERQKSMNTIIITKPLKN